MLSLLHILAASGGGGGTVTLSGETVTDVGSSPGQAYIIVRTDGTIDKNEGGTVTQIDSSTDWIIPNVSASTSYQFKWEQVSGDALTWANIAASTWTPITTDIQLGYITGAPGNEAGVFTLHVRLGTGAEIDSASYTCDATEI